MSVIACGWSRSLLLASDGTVWCCGQNEHGQLGFGDQVERHTLSRNPSLNNISSISCGYSHNLCIDEMGIVWSFGRNQHGQLGIGNVETNRTPVIIKAFADQQISIVSVACGGYSSFCIDCNGNAWSFGDNSRGSLGLKTKEISVTLPQKVCYSGDIVSISSQSFNTLFLTSNNNVFVCRDGQVRFVKTAKFEILEDIAEIAAGAGHSLCRATSGEVYGFGDNKYGELGLGHQMSISMPTAIPNLPPIAAICCGMTYSLFLDYEGDLWGCGDNSKRKIGIVEPNTYITSPIKLQLSNINTIGRSMLHICVKRNDGAIFMCGDNTSGQLSTGCTNNPQKFKQINVPFELMEPKSLSRAKSARK